MLGTCHTRDAVRVEFTSLSITACWQFSESLFGTGVQMLFGKDGPFKWIKSGATTVLYQFMYSVQFLRYRELQEESPQQPLLKLEVNHLIALPPECSTMHV